jgi:hypothetical protein
MYSVAEQSPYKTTFFYTNGPHERRDVFLRPLHAVVTRFCKFIDTFFHHDLTNHLHAAH